MRLFSATEVSARAEVAMLHDVLGQERILPQHTGSSPYELAIVSLVGGSGVLLPTGRALSEKSSFSRSEQGARILSDRVERSEWRG